MNAGSTHDHATTDEDDMTDTTDTPNHCLFFDAKGLFFDAKGNGPSAVRLIDREVRELVEDGKTVVPRAFGLCWEVTGPLRFVEDGGFMLDAGGVTWLRDKLTAWLDAPRLAAREKAEVVETRPARDGTGDTNLVRTADFGEWAVISPRGGLYCGCGAWGEGARQARGVFDIVPIKELP